MAFKDFPQTLLNRLKSDIKADVNIKLMKIFGWFGVINFPLFYLVPQYLTAGNYESLLLRTIAFMLSLGLVFVDRWPLSLNKFIPLIWHLTIIYCLPFFGTYMFLDNINSISWLTNITIGLVWLVLITNWVTFILSLAIGISLGTLTHYLMEGPTYLDMGVLGGAFANYIWAAIIAAIFSHRKELIQQEKQRTLQMQAGAIAHEMRTPLLSLSGVGYFLKTVIPSLIKDRNRLEPNQRAGSFSEKQLAYTLNAPETIEKVTRQAFSFIDIMLMNLRENFKDATIETCSVDKCVEQALVEYPFGGDDRSMVKTQFDRDFEFKGNSLLIKHVFFNLLKNSIYYVKAADKGEITVRTYTAEGINLLSFKDTGTGIAPDILPHVFDKFYSKTKYGTGIGLAFCRSVMKSLGGDIRCKSQYGEYTEFILTFPPLEKS
ncbi:MAG: HAMP domain-containing histidine kinase [Alphaproteobacteria bacterium]|nr:HAMP domain-containing histidine kinase [Alphaproteobacteria bacterium]